VNLPGLMSLGIWIGVVAGICVALAIIWPRARPKRPENKL